jgi:hypothetical protein
VTIAALQDYGRERGLLEAIDTVNLATSLRVARMMLEDLLPRFEVTINGHRHTVRRRFVTCAQLRALRPLDPRETFYREPDGPVQRAFGESETFDLDNGKPRAFTVCRRMGSEG